MIRNTSKLDCDYMGLAIQEAKKSERELEVPVGAIIVHENQVISRGRNRRENLKNSLLHAEIEAIYFACKKLGSWRLLGCSIYVTLEPCAMCAGAIINSRINKLCYGAHDPKSGSCGSVVNLFDLPYNHRPKLISGVLEKDCSEMLSNFFKKLRKNNL